MPGKRVQFDDETWQSIDAVASRQGQSFQELADEAFKDLLKKHHQPVGLKAALKESVGAHGKAQQVLARTCATLVAEADEL
jgi:hypothetical protein